ncbi:MAG: serine/threonine-protein kinase [Pirellulaceae bacterium]
MNTDGIDPSRVDDIFLRAVALPEKQRCEFLDAACADESPQLRQRIDQLLAADQHVAEAAGFMRQGPFLGNEHPAEGLGCVIGNYSLVRQLGEGGFGVVYLAEQRHPLNRQVALKIIKPGMDSRELVARFEQERQAMAMMDHPNITKVFDAGITAAGRLFFVMELVQGDPITKHCDEHQLSVRERLELFLPVCHAIQHAHQKGVIHRDIKPSNVLIGYYDGKLVPKVIDFGVAKALHQRLTEETLKTHFGNLIGTLQYMSPEQAGLAKQDVDTRSDIYSLGAVLYELLTGIPPLNSDRMRDANLENVFRLIRDEEPLVPSDYLLKSASLPELARRFRLHSTQLISTVRHDLDWVVCKALEKERARRYASAGELARDIERFLLGQPVEAGPVSATYRIFRFLRRHRAQVASAAVLFVILTVTTAVSLRSAWLAHQSEGRAQQAQAAANVGAAARKRDLMQTHLSLGTRFLAEQNYPEAAVRFAEAMRLDQDDRDGQRLHRMRCAAALSACVKPSRIWQTTMPANMLKVSTDDRRLIAFPRASMAYYAEDPVALKVWGLNTAQPSRPGSRHRD